MIRLFCWSGCFLFNVIHSSRDDDIYTLVWVFSEQVTTRIIFTKMNANRELREGRGEVMYSLAPSNGYDHGKCYNCM